MKPRYINMSAHMHLHINTGIRPKAISLGAFGLQADVGSGDQVSEFCSVCWRRGRKYSWLPHGGDWSKSIHVARLVMSASSLTLPLSLTLAP